MNPKYKKPRAKRGKKAPAKLSAPVKAAVTQMLRAESENKMVSYKAPYNAGLLISLVNGPINAPLNDSSSWVRLIPAVAQGTGLGQRVGNKIRPVSCTLRIVISCIANLPSVDLMVRLFMVSDKSVKSYNIENPAVGTTTIAYLKLLDGGGVPSQYIGSAVDSLIPINTNQFTKHHDRLIHLVKSQGIETSFGTPPTFGDNASATTATLYHTTLKVPLPKVLKYDQDLDLYPSNSAPYLCVGYAYHNNAQLVSNQCGFQALTTLVFEDA